MAKPKEFRLPKIEEVAVYEVEVAGYGTVIVPIGEARKRGGLMRHLAHHGIKEEQVVGYIENMREIEYIENLPAYAGKK